MTELEKNQQQLDRDYRRDCFGAYRMIFCEYIACKPTLYEGVELDPATIDYINNYFYFYKINPVNFEVNFLNKLRRAVGTYNNLKEIELQKSIFSITTNKTVRELVQNATNQLKTTNKYTAKQTDTGTIKDEGTSENTLGTKQTNSKNNSSQNKTQVANRVLPMNNQGSWSELFDWEGASNKEENRNELSGSESSSTQNSGTDTGKNNNTRTLGTEINNEDKRVIKDLATRIGNDKEIIETTGSQVVNLVSNIWNYLVSPKAIDYLTEELKSCFILVL